MVYQTNTIPNDRVRSSSKAFPLLNTPWKPWFRWFFWTELVDFGWFIGWSISIWRGKKFQPLNAAFKQEEAREGKGEGRKGREGQERGRSGRSGRSRGCQRLHWVAWLNFCRKVEGLDGDICWPSWPSSGHHLAIEVDGKGLEILVPSRLAPQFFGDRPIQLMEFPWRNPKEFRRGWSLQIDRSWSNTFPVTVSGAEAGTSSTDPKAGLGFTSNKHHVPTGSSAKKVKQKGNLHKNCWDEGFIWDLYGIYLYYVLLDLFLDDFCLVTLINVAWASHVSLIPGRL